ncbi:hypothetical protein BegalDRAFT_3118 [Beggiatoa alba B18LD]|uniref:Ig-like domain-containing protein n=1 Tax=Beggiatoa alba B18LD TaxID=395493 RepID=I3CK00_9GAMM|nr:hypothetical protein [Beggiatoa alba]EIJ43943.1 hypothetical protein BegalDRAFT_3118 [Beggiatoa alba B18LD]
MNFKKTALASAIALTLATGSVMATTTTVGGEFILDKATINAGGTINLALLGLDSSGAVDRFGEQQGSVIIAVVNTIKGEIVGGSTYPGATPDDPRPSSGQFTSQVRYFRLNQGNGQVSINYPVTATGTDSVTITLQERIPTTGGGVEFKTIASAERVVTINPPSSAPKALNVVEFKASALDPEKALGTTDDGIWADGITGKMTAGVAGAQIIVESENPSAAGELTVTLRKGSTSVPYTTQMQLGKAIVTLDNKVTSAGKYYIEATFKGFDGNSVDLLYPDTVEVISTGLPRSIVLSANKQRLNVNAGQGATVSATLKDEYGNTTTSRAGTAITVEVKDANTTTTGVAAFDIPVGVGASKGSYQIGVAGSSAFTKASTASLVGTALSGPNRTTVSGITASAPLAISAVEKTLVVSPLFTTAQMAGTEFKAFTVVTSDNNANVGPITIQNTTTSESLTVNRDPSTNVVQGFFKTATDGATYLISDSTGVYAQQLVDAAGIIRAAATNVELRNAHNQKVTSVYAGTIASSTDRAAYIPERSLKMFDTFGNSVTPGSPGGTGTFTASSTNSISVSYMGTGTASAGIPDLSPGGVVEVRYATVGTKAFSGTDNIALAFDKPGLGTNNITVTTNVSAPEKLTAINAYITQDKIPTNSEVALTVEILDQDGNPYPTTDVTVLFNDGLTGEGVIQNPDVRDLSGNIIATGQQLFTTAGSRKVLVVGAGAVEGTFKLTFRNPDGSVKAERTFTVASAYEGQCSTSNLSACTTQVDCESALGFFAGDKCSVRPELTSTGSVFDPTTGEVTEGTLDFFGGIYQALKAGDGFTKTAVLSCYGPNNPVSIQAAFQVDPADVGKGGEVLIVGLLTIGEFNFSGWYMMDLNNIVTWDGMSLAGLTAAKEVGELPSLYSSVLYQGQFYIGGLLNLYVGYRNPAGKVVFSSSAIQANIVNTDTCPN